MGKNSNWAVLMALFATLGLAPNCSNEQEQATVQKQEKEDINQIVREARHYYYRRDFDTAALHLDLLAFEKIFSAMLGYAYTQTGQLDKAIEAYRHAKAIPKDERKRMELVAGNSDYIIPASEECIAMVKQGYLLCQQKQYISAENWAKQVVKMFPDNLEPLTLLGLAYMFEKKYDQAERVFKDLTKKFPKNPEVFRDLGDVYRWKNDFKDAIAAYEMAVFLGPEDPDSHISLVYALLGLGFFPDRPDYSRVVDRKRFTQKRWNRIVHEAQIVRELGGENTEQKIPYLRLVDHILN